MHPFNPAPLRPGHPKLSRVWPVLSLLVLTAGLSACGGSSSSSSASVRLVNATLTHPSLDLWANAALAQSATALDSVSAYAQPTSGSASLQVDDAGLTTALSTVSSALVGDGHYALVAYESGGAVNAATVQEDWPLPATGAATLRVTDFAQEAGKLDVYVTTAPVAQAANVAALSPVGTLLPSVAGAALSLTFGPGSYYVAVTASGNPTDVRMMNMPVTLTNQEVANALLTPATGGQLLNGSLLVQQGSYSAFRNTGTRVRLASAVSGNATVAASATSAGSTTTIDSGSVAPQFDSYTLVPASSALNISVNGASVSTPATALVKGGDMTLLVYGAPDSSVATLLTDDNRPPADATMVKLRLINGITGNSANMLALTANSASVASAIAPAAASTYAAVAGSANPMTLSFSSNQKSGIYFSDSSHVLNAGGVFTVLAVGDFSAPFLLIR
ncbi:MAG: hypothetical protein JWQ33_2053 [Ramlibacter sp.]|nr:hypothetical protein [Ramlibacter sp.]